MVVRALCSCVKNAVKNFGWYCWLHALPHLRTGGGGRVHVQPVNNGRYAPALITNRAQNYTTNA